jgi:hypothetical protein
VQSAVNNKISADATGFEVYAGSSDTTSSGVKITSAGILGYKSGVPTFTLTSGGDATFAGTLSAATGSFSGAVTATSGSIGGFDLGSTYGDLTAKTITSVRPRIIFGTKVLLGWIASSNYGLQIGNPYTSTSYSFRVNTVDDVNRISVDTSRSLDYAAEITNDVRARQYRYVAGGGLVNDTSSRRFKENITYAPKSYYDRILNIDPAFYTYKYNHPETSPEVWGVHAFGPIAEDLEDAGLGLFVQRNLMGQPTSLINEHKLPLLLIPIIRELKETIELMQQRILDLESR